MSGAPSYDVIYNAWHKDAAVATATEDKQLTVYAGAYRIISLWRVWQETYIY